MSVRAAVMTVPEAPLEVWELDEPRIEDGSVVLETVASEVCGTDVHLWHGRLDGVPYPIVPGHVSVGRIVESRGVERDALGAPLARGDLVTFLDVAETCHACYQCLVAGQPNRCPSRKVYGITYSAQDGPLGGWAERIHLRPGVRILKLPEGLEADDVIGGGCGLFTGLAAVERSGLELGDAVLVQGSGPVGLSAAAFARLRGAGLLIMIGAPESRLALGARMGVDETYELDATAPEERAERIMALTRGRGVDVVLEATGNPEALREGLGLLRDGGTYVVAGHYTDAGPVTLNPHTDINRKHARILGRWGTEFRHFVRALDLLARHRDRLPFRDVIGRRYRLEEAQTAIEDVEGLRVTKALIVP